MAATRRRPFWQDLGTLATLLLLLSFVLTLKEPITNWFEGTKKYDREVLQEWFREARVYRTLPSLLEDYLRQVKTYREAVEEIQPQLEKLRQANGSPEASLTLLQLENHLVGLKDQYQQRQDEIRTHLQAMLEPVAKVYKTQLPLFPMVYRVALSFDPKMELPNIVWESQVPRRENQYVELDPPLKLEIRYREGNQEITHEVAVQMQYHLRVYASREYQQRQEAARLLQMGSLFTVFLTLLLLWFYLAQGRERERQRHRLLAEQQLNEAERLRLEEELRRQEAERRHEEAERSNLELKSQLWANIGILAGSYAHNIKNLLVRPNDLLVRCLEADGLSSKQENMLHEVRHTLGTVTERLQQILQTVRRDPTQAEHVRIDLNELVEEMRHTWQDLAGEKWKLTLTLELGKGPLWIEGDRSHMQQAVENLLFNARDATFEMRNYLREQARQGRAGEIPVAAGGQGTAGVAAPPAQDRRQALIAAASWTGAVILRTYRDKDHAVLEVWDNGIGMTEEVRRRCTESHFSTKRNSALFAGFNAGMGLGLSFIKMILEHHRADMDIESGPFKGTTFRIAFPLAQDQDGLA